MLDVDAVELDAIGPGERVGLEEVLDLVVVDVEGKHLVRRLRHDLLAEVGPDEPSRADHAYGQWLYRVPVQIYSRRRRHCRFFFQRSSLFFLSLSFFICFFSLCVFGSMENCRERGWENDGQSERERESNE